MCNHWPGGNGSNQPDPTGILAALGVGAVRYQHPAAFVGVGVWSVGQWRKALDQYRRIAIPTVRD